MEIECNSCGAIMVIPKRKPTGKAADLLKIAEEAKFNATGDAEYAFRALEMGLRELEDDSARLDWEEGILHSVGRHVYPDREEVWVWGNEHGRAGTAATLRAAIDAARAAAESGGQGDD